MVILALAATPATTGPPVGSGKLIRNCFLVRPLVLDAARVKENWFSGSPSMARYYQLTFPVLLFPRLKLDHLPRTARA